MLAGLIAPRLHLDFVSASISCEHCRSSRNNPHYEPRHIIYYYFQGCLFEIQGSWISSCPYSWFFVTLVQNSIMRYYTKTLIGHRSRKGCLVHIRVCNKGCNTKNKICLENDKIAFCILFQWVLIVGSNTGCFLELWLTNVDECPNISKSRRTWLAYAEKKTKIFRFLAELWIF